MAKTTTTKRVAEPAKKRVQRTRSQSAGSSRCLEIPVDSPAGRGRPLKRTQRDRLPQSKTKAPLDNGHPVFRKRPNGQLEAKLSQEAQRHGAGRRPLGAAQQGGSLKTTWKTPKVVKAEAKARVRSEGGDPRNEWLVLSRYAIQVGTYKGRDFKWLLENKVSYVATLVANHQRDQEHSAIENPEMANKDSLTRYAMAYPEVQKLVSMRKRATSLVGFGKCRTETLQDLYESKDKLKISYVGYLQNKENCTPGSKMEAAVRYILQRDKEPAASGPAKRRVQRTHSQRTRSQSAGSSRCLEIPVGSPAGRGRPLKRTQQDRVPYKHFVDKHKVQLINRVSNVGPILDELLEGNVIQGESYDKIRALATSQEKMRELYATSLKAGNTCKNIFYKSLKKNEPLLVEDLQGK